MKTKCPRCKTIIIISIVKYPYTCPHCFYVIERKLNLCEKWIVDFLKGKCWTSPTRIGNAYGGGQCHSSWASPKCLRLVEMGLLERDDRGWYRLKGDM